MIHKPYKCPLCHEMFASYYIDFYKHMDEQHGSKFLDAGEESALNEEPKEGDSEVGNRYPGDGTFTHDNVRALLRYTRHRYNQFKK